MLIDIKKIHPNPYRDFDLYPFDEDQVENLMLSFADNGDFGILPARPNESPGTYQIACGHHRVEAMRRLGFAMADLKIGDYDDDQMVRIMVDENAKQMGQNSAAILDSVCAAIQRVAYATLTGEWDRSQEFLRTLYESETAFIKARSWIENGSGVGQVAIERYLDRRLPASKIQSALATIKASKRHASIVNKVMARIGAERKESERLAEEARQEQEHQAHAAAEAEEQGRKEAEAWQRKLEKMEREKEAAQKAANDAKQKREKEIAELRQKELAARQKAEVEQRKAEEELRRKRQVEATKMAEEMQRNRTAADATAKRQKEASERAVRAMEQTTARAPDNKFDTRIASVFKNDHQLDVFRKAITTGTLAKVLPEDRQYACAAECKAWHDRNKVELTAKSITDWLSRELDGFLRQEKKISQREHDLAMKESADRSILRDYDDLRDAVVKITTSCVRLKEKYEAYPSEFTPPVNLAVTRLMPRAIEDLQRLYDRLIKLA